jgi:hypothetical protein
LQDHVQQLQQQRCLSRAVGGYPCGVCWQCRPRSVEATPGGRCCRATSPCAPSQGWMDGSSSCGASSMLVNSVQSHASVELGSPVRGSACGDDHSQCDHTCGPATSQARAAPPTRTVQTRRTYARAHMTTGQRRHRIRHATASFDATPMQQQGAKQLSQWQGRAMRVLRRSRTVRLVQAPLVCSTPQPVVSAGGVNVAAAAAGLCGCAEPIVFHGMHKRRAINAAVRAAPEHDSASRTCTWVIDSCGVRCGEDGWPESWGGMYASCYTNEATAIRPERCRCNQGCTRQACLCAACIQPLHRDSSKHVLDCARPCLAMHSGVQCSPITLSCHRSASRCSSCSRASSPSMMLGGWPCVAGF